MTFQEMSTHVAENSRKVAAFAFGACAIALLVSLPLTWTTGTAAHAADCASGFCGLEVTHWQWSGWSGAAWLVPVSAVLGTLAIVLATRPDAHRPIAHISVAIPLFIFLAVLFTAHLDETMDQSHGPGYRVAMAALGVTILASAWLLLTAPRRVPSRRAR